MMFIVFNCLFALFNELSLIITNNQANDIFKETMKEVIFIKSVS